VYNTTDGDLELSGLAPSYFDISQAVYSQSFSVNAQDITPVGIAFNTDGTKMFVLGNAGQDVNEYTLTIGFDVSTASYSQNFSVGGQENNPQDFKFNTDGTKMFILGVTGDDVNEYTLGTGFDVSTASFVDSFSVASQETTPTGLAFNNDGTKMYVVGFVGDEVYQYTLTTGFDVSTASYASISFSVSSEQTSPTGIAFNTDGTKMFISGDANDEINEYTLGTGFDLSTASFSQVISVAGQETTPQGIAFNNDGSKMFVIGYASDNVNEYSLGVTALPTGYHAVHTTSSIDSTYWTDINSMTADEAAGDGNVYYAISTDDRTTWTVIDNTDGERDIVRNNGGTWQYNSNSTYASETWVNGTTNTELATLAEAMEGAVDNVGFYLANASYANKSFDASNEAGSITGIAFKSDGLKMYIIGRTADNIYQYTLSTAYDVSTASYDSVSFSLSSQEINALELVWKSDGTKFYICGYTTDTVYEYNVSSAWDLSTASYSSNSFSVASQEASPSALAFNSDGTKMFVVGYSSDNVHSYTLSSAYDVSSASYDSVSFSVASQAIQPYAMRFNSDGTKMFIMDNTTNSWYQYTLTTGFDVSTASYSSISFSYSSQSSVAFGGTFANSGLNFYITSSGDTTIYQYNSIQYIYINQMNKTQLEAVTDANHFTLGNDLDLAIIFNLTSGTTVPSSDGVSINYDANTLNEGAILGTDYDFDFPATDKVRITALAANNLKVRVV